MSKVTNNYALLQEEILPDEQVYWVGQPDVSGIRLVARLTPLLFIGGLVTLFLELPFGSLMILFGMIGLPQVAEYNIRRSTYYAVTDMRVLIVTGIQGIHASSYPLRKLPSITKRISVKGANSITFGIQARRNQPFVDGRTFFSTEWTIPSHVGFYHLRDIDTVYRLLVELQVGRDVSWIYDIDEKPKRKRQEV
jgi:hypothetical protein